MKKKKDPRPVHLEFCTPSHKERWYEDFLDVQKRKQNELIIWIVI